MKRMTALLLFLITCPAIAQTRSPVDLANAQVPPGARRIAYGTDPLQFGELRVPATKGPHPVAIVIHGPLASSNPIGNNTRYGEASGDNFLDCRLNLIGKIPANCKRWHPLNGDHYLIFFTDRAVGVRIFFFSSQI